MSVVSSAVTLAICLVILRHCAGVEDDLPSSKPTMMFIAPSVPAELEPMFPSLSMEPAGVPTVQQASIEEQIPASPQYQSVLNSTVYMLYGMLIVTLVGCIVTYKRFNRPTETGKYSSIAMSDPDEQ